MMKDGEASCCGSVHLESRSSQGRVEHACPVVGEGKGSGRNLQVNGFTQGCCLHTKQTRMTEQEPCVNSTVLCSGPDRATTLTVHTYQELRFPPRAAVEDPRTPVNFLLHLPICFTIKCSSFLTSAFNFSNSSLNQKCYSVFSLTLE